jgi:natural product precursor
MKIKKSRERLTLNKQTIASLNEQAMKIVIGGATYHSCISCPTEITLIRTDCVTNCRLCLD